jgi:hypothetical protein
VELRLERPKRVRERREALEVDLVHLRLRDVEERLQTERAEMLGLHFVFVL